MVFAASFKKKNARTMMNDSSPSPSPSSSSSPSSCCDTCGSEYNALAYQQHRHHQQTTPSFSLSLCDKCYNDIDILKKVVEVHGFLERIYHICPEAYTDRVKRDICKSVFIQIPVSHLSAPSEIIIPAAANKTTGEEEEDEENVVVVDYPEIDPDELQFSAADLLEHIRDMNSFHDSGSRGGGGGDDSPHPYPFFQLQ